MAGAGYKLFNTGDVLTAAQVNTYLQEQAVMRFANSTARTTALSGVLAEGMMSYLDDTNSVEVYNGGAWVSVGSTGDITGVTAGTGISGGGTSGDVTITNSMATAIDAKGDLIAGTGADTFSRLAVGGTNGHILKVNSSTSTGLEWGAASSGGDLIKVGGGAFSAVSSVNVNDVFSSTYKKYRIVIDYVLAGATGRNLNLRWRVSGADDTNSTYDYSYGYLNINGFGNATINYATAPANLTVIAYNNGDSNQANCRSAVSIDVHNPYDSGWTVYTGTSYSGDYQGAVNLIGGAFRNTTSFTGFTFYPTASTITGSYAVYGYTN